MQRYISFLFLAILVLLPPLLLMAQPTPGVLHPGDVFPQVAGETLTGKSLKLPAASAGRPAVIVFSFSRVAGGDARLWNEHLAKDAVPAYTVIMLESVPKLFRGLAVSGIKSNMPLPVQERTMVSYHDESLWKQRLAVSGDSRAYVVLLGPDSHVRGNNSAAFNDTQYVNLKHELEELLEPR